MIRVTGAITIDESELAFSFVRSPGPGGQNVNKVATACQLRFDVAGSNSLPADVKRRLRALAGSRMTASGELVLIARRYRTQLRNRTDAVERLTAMLRSAATAPKHRRPTRPTGASIRRRLQAKLRRGQTKRLRKPPTEE
ncbi:MAG: aminoacyl-tRNA hydrolase [Planctomycetes bacterium]|nr:aminoacyl-tRNA hydrolase [Planctomycetota bacterium]